MNTLGSYKITHYGVVQGRVIRGLKHARGKRDRMNTEWVRELFLPLEEGKRFLKNPNLWPYHLRNMQ